MNLVQGQKQKNNEQFYYTYKANLLSCKDLFNTWLSKKRIGFDNVK